MSEFNKVDNEAIGNCGRSIYELADCDNRALVQHLQDTEPSRVLVYRHSPKEDLLKSLNKHSAFLFSRILAATLK